MEQLSIVLMSIVCLAWLNPSSGEGNNCPAESEILPHCWCLESFYGGTLLCKDIFSPRDLVAPIDACRNRKVTALGIYNSSLQYIPHDLFHDTQFDRISFLNTQLMALSNSPLAFEGLENSLEELRAVATQYTTLWRFRQLRELKALTLIDINSIVMESLSERLPAFPNLTAFGLIRAGITYLDDELLTDCHALRILDMRQNHISEVKRSMLPNPANDLHIINFQNNEIAVLPSDFFEAMPNIMDVNFGGNKITTLDEKTFFWIYTHVQTLDLTGNPIRCDCRMSWIVNRKSPHWLHAKCTEPESVKDKKLNYLTLQDVYCFSAGKIDE